MGGIMKRKMIAAKLTALALTTVFASGLMIQSVSAYEISVGTNLAIENINQ